MRLTGRSGALLRAQGVHLRRALEETWHFVEGTPSSAQNARFDRVFLDAHAEPCAIPFRFPPGMLDPGLQAPDTRQQDPRPTAHRLIDGSCWSHGRSLTGYRTHPSHRCLRIKIANLTTGD